MDIFRRTPVLPQMTREDVLAQQLMARPVRGLDNAPQPQATNPTPQMPTFQGEAGNVMAQYMGQAPRDSALNTVLGFTEGPATIKAYHGSPHAFDRFDMSRIGTGEGAQAYGHGLYFAGNEATARSYRDTLSGGGMKITFPDGTSRQASIPQLTGPLMDAMTTAGVDGPGYMKTAIARAHLQQSPDLMADALKGAFGDMHLPPDKMEQARATMAGMIERARPVLDSYQLSKPGSMYEVRLNTDPSRLLDWDKPLSQQAAPVQGALQQFGIKADPQAMAAYDDALLAALQGDGAAKLPKQPSDPMGGAIYESSRIVPGGYRDPVAASQSLREAGIDGIQYLDQGSRAAGEGSRNYVMFDDKLIDIIRRYGIAGVLGGAAAAGAGSTDALADALQQPQR